MLSSLSALLLLAVSSLSTNTASASPGPALMPRTEMSTPRKLPPPSLFLRKKSFTYGHNTTLTHPPATDRPTSYGVLLYRAFEPLDVFGPLTALQTTSRYHHMTLSLISATLDPVTTEPLTPRMNPQNSSFFQQVLPTHTLATAPPLDVLLVPGGLGSRSPFLNDSIAFIADRFDSLQYLLTVCTGSMLAAKAGVLDGRRATANKASWNETVALGPAVNWVPTARWVEDGKVWTSSGVSAGIDLTLAFIEHIYGAENASTIADYMEFERAESSLDDPFAEVFDVPGWEEGVVGGDLDGSAYADGDADRNDSYVDERLLGRT